MIYLPVYPFALGNKVWRVHPLTGFPWICVFHVGRPATFYPMMNGKTQTSYLVAVKSHRARLHAVGSIGPPQGLV